MKKFKFIFYLLIFFVFQDLSFATYNGAALLPDGNYMFCGGASAPDTPPTNSCYVFSTTANINIPIANMTLTRSSFTLTVLSNGNILAAGGYNSGTPVDSMEIYDPNANTWANTPNNLSSARAGHTATLIPSGTHSGSVLICGGQIDATNVSNTCDIITNTGALITTINMNSKRFAHATTLLPNGKIFISGGLQDLNYSTTTFLPSTSSYLSSQEIYDPITDSITPVDSLLESRAYHNIVTLNNGNVLIIGGYNQTNQRDIYSKDEKGPEYGDGEVDVQTAQEQGNYGYLESFELFDQNGSRLNIYATGTSSTLGTLPYRISKSVSILSGDGEVNIYNGYGNIPVSYVQPEFEIYDPSYLNLDIDVSTITGGSVNIKAKDIYQLSRPEITGRLVNSDFFLASYDPKQEKPSFTVENIEGYIGNSTATLDSSRLICKFPNDCGYLGNKIVPLLNPQNISNSYIKFNPLSFSIESAKITDGGYNFTYPLLGIGAKTPLLNTSTITFTLYLELPPIYKGANIKGNLKIEDTIIQDDQTQYSITLKDLAPITFGPINIETNIATITITALDIQGQEITSSTETLYSTNTIANNDNLSGLTITMEFKSDRVLLNSSNNTSPTTFMVGESTVVIREMIFGNLFRFAPKDFSFTSWLNDIIPSFDSIGFLTPGADKYFSYGLNCETGPNPNPSVSCLRDTKYFNETNVSSAYLVNILEKPWPKGPELNEKRGNHTSTILPNNDILTCGGTNGAITLKSCELFLNKESKFIYTSSMTFARSEHTSTLLPNGQVLIVGGTTGDVSSSVYISSAEIYYPDVKRFVPTTSMNTPRGLHTATLLANGNVLVVGGATNGGYPTTSEIYITTNATWQNITNPLANQRQEHTATFLKNNTVLITGGINGNSTLNTTYIFDPSNNTFTAGPNLTVPRKNHTATLLKDGRVLITGGSNGQEALDTSEIYNGTIFSPVIAQTTGLELKMLKKRANHKATLLPNGKVMLTGGENPGLYTGFAEIYDVDFPTYTLYGLTGIRQRHTAVINSSGAVVLIGGFDGTKYLNTTSFIYFTENPDEFGLETSKRRRPILSYATPYFDKDENVTLLSNATNFHSITEAASGSAGRNASYSNPRIYLSAVDNPSGFLIDLTTRIYNSINTNWQTTMSSITITMPSNIGELPYGYYNFYASNNSQFSEGYLVQVTSPRPTGQIAVPILGSVLGSTSIQWQWNKGSLDADGYAIFASSNNVFISTKALDDPAIFIHTDLQPNTPDSIKVTGFNLGGYGSVLIQSPTYYTYANIPNNLNLEKVGFNEIELSWSPNGNSNITPYEISIAEGYSAFDAFVSTPVPFSNNHTSTSAVISGLTPNKMYYFRIRAKNGNDIETDFSSIVSTITLGTITNLNGTPLDSNQIYWSWDESIGADAYEIFDITSGTDTPVYLASTTVNNYIQSYLLSNSTYTVKVRAFKNYSGNDIFGPFTNSESIATLSATPLPGAPNSYMNVTANSFDLNWISNGNPSYTNYFVQVSSYSDFSIITSSKIVTMTNTSITNLKPNYPYYSRVCSLNLNNIASPFTNLGLKYTLAEPPLNVKPLNISLSGVLLGWEKGENSPETIYQVKRSTDITMSSVTVTIPYGGDFNDNLKDNFLLISGLWTNTTYYMSVSARNKEGFVTSEIRAIPNPITLSGPSGTPPMSIGGTSDPTKTSVIQGILPPDPYTTFFNPDGRPVSLIIPTDSFSEITQIAISSSDANNCSWLLEGTHPISFNIYSERQPKEPVIFKFNYTEGEAYASPNGIDNNRLKVVLSRYNPISGQCIPLETEINTSNREITAKLNHFSNFQLILYEPATDLNNVNIYPNPFYPNKGQGYITLNNMPANSKIQIYTLTGDEVYETTSNGSGNAYWTGKNKKGFYVGSGIYLCLIKSSTGKKVFKIAIER